MDQSKDIESGGVSKFEFFSAISVAADIFERIRTGHSRRIAYSAVRLASYMEMNIEDVCRLYYSGILHDVGIGFAFNEAASEIKDVGLSAHAIHGSKIVDDFFNDDYITSAVMYHHENWDGTGPFGQRGDEIPLYAQILRISDFLDNNFDKKASCLIAKDENRKAILKERGKFFSEGITDAFLEMTEEESFWLDYKNENINFAFRKIEAFDKSILKYDDLIKISRIYAKMVDEKSRFTPNHSTCIAANMEAIANLKGFSILLQKKACIAGLLHDLGKAAVLSSIINKPGPLTIEERNHVNSHSYYTRMILEQIPGFEDITEWATNHHELINGKGYPNRLKGDQLDYFSRLLTVCDVYQAIREDRAYRKAMSDEKAWETICEMRDSGMLCPDACNDLKSLIDSKNIN